MLLSPSTSRVPICRRIDSKFVSGRFFRNSSSIFRENGHSIGNRSGLSSIVDRNRSQTLSSSSIGIIAVGNRSSNQLHTTTSNSYEEYNNPRFSMKGETQRVRDILEHDWRRMNRRYNEYKYDYYKRKELNYTMTKVMQYELFPIESDFFIVGGGLMGSVAAWWMKQRARDEDTRVVVVESDETFGQNATSLSCGAIRTQFSQPELVEAAVFGAEFLRNAGEHLRILDNDPPKIDFTPMGHLYLCDNEEKAKRMEAAVKIQIENGAKVGVYNRDELKLRFPWMKVDDVLFGTMGLENEGIIDPWQVLSAFREKNMTLGVQYVKAKVLNFEYEQIGDLNAKMIFRDEDQWKFCRMTNAVVLPEMCDAAPRPVRATIVYNCAGPWASDVARSAGLGLGHKRNFMSLPVPIERRKRYVFVVHCPDGPGLDMPFVIDPSGVWCRRDTVNGNLYICGKKPSDEEDADVIDHSNLDVDYKYFDERIWPVLAKRIPAFESMKVKSAWAGYYDHNWYDDAPIIGTHIANRRFHNMCGFGGSGLSLAIGVGRGAMEKYYDGAYVETNFRRFGLERMMQNKKIIEDYAI